MKKHISTAIAFLLLSTLEFAAQEANNYGAATFLNITPDATSLALGGAGVGTPGGAYSFFHNGAAMMFSESKSAIGYSYSPWLSDNTLHSAGGFYKISPRHGLTAGVRYYTYPKINAKDDDGNPLSSYNPAEFSVDVGYAATIMQDLAVSATLRYVSSDMGSFNGAKTANAVAFDLGIMYSPENGIGDKADWAVGVNLRNVGTKLKYLNTKESIPAVLTVGGSVDTHISPKHNLLAVIDLSMGINPSDAAGLAAGGGLEYSFMKKVVLRGGYHYGDKDKGGYSFASAGGGLKYFGFNADFSYLFAGSGTALENTFIITIGYTF